MNNFLKKISSLQHPLVKHLVNLRQNKDYREEHQRAVVCGNKVIEELSSIVRFSNLLVKEGFEYKTSIQSDNFIEVSEGILKKISGVVNPEELIAELPLPKPSNLKNKKRLLTLDGISDPGNLGTLIRSALAFGWEAIFLANHCVDPFNDKAIRASKGACFLIEILSGDKAQLEEVLKESHFTTYIADIHGKTISQSSFIEPIHLILGSEANGPSEEMLDLGTKITIPMSEGTESLNVGVAGGILMFILGPYSKK